MAAGQESSPAQRFWDACPSPLGRGRLGPGETTGPGAGAAGRAPPPPVSGLRNRASRQDARWPDGREDSFRLTQPVLTLSGRAMFARGSRRRRSGRAVSEIQGSGGVRGKLRLRRGAEDRDNEEALHRGFGNPQPQNSQTRRAGAAGRVWMKERGDLVAHAP